MQGDGAASTRFARLANEFANETERRLVERVHAGGEGTENGAINVGERLDHGKYPCGSFPSHGVQPWADFYFRQFVRPTLGRLFGNAPNNLCAVLTMQFIATVEARPPQTARSWQSRLIPWSAPIVT